MFKVEFGNEYIETNNVKEAIATYVYHKLLVTNHIRFLELIEEEDEEGWEKWREIKHPISHYEINIEELDK